MARLIRGTLFYVLRASGFVLLGALFVSIVGLVVYVQSEPPLAVWHKASLDEEFTAESQVDDFAAYLSLEDRLFAELDDEVYSQVPTGPEHAVNRYSRGSLSDPGRWSTNWNRTFEIPVADPVAGALLLHGLSDSPYSLRALGEQLADARVSVVALRIPGHGTAPSGLLDVTWQDMAAAVELAVRHLDEAIGERPLHIVGYSNGGALAVEYALASVRDESNRRPEGVVLLSPEIGVTRFAALASWQGGLGHLLGLEKLAWSSIGPEYDPFKYDSFAINAGDLAYRITGRIQSQLDGLARDGKLSEVPPILAFQSAVDATVSAAALVEHLLARLPPNDHELVLFDINRMVGIEPLLKQDPAAIFGPLLRKPDRSFDLTIVTNATEGSHQVVAKRTPQGSSERTVSALEARWPAGVYSLAHISLPFSPRDAVYGGPQAAASPGVQLGNMALRGERGALRISGGDLLRLHWNPFYDYVETRVMDFMLPAGR